MTSSTLFLIVFKDSPDKKLRCSIGCHFCLIGLQKKLVLGLVPLTLLDPSDLLQSWLFIQKLLLHPALSTDPFPPLVTAAPFSPSPIFDQRLGASAKKGNMQNLNCRLGWLVLDVVPIFLFDPLSLLQCWWFTLLSALPSPSQAPPFPQSATRVCWHAVSKY